MSLEAQVLATVVQPGLYRHYKGAEYRVYEEATCTDTERPVIVYRQLSTGRLFTRDKVVFLENVAVQAEPLTIVPRFERVGD